ncbi:very short patch repair endonuclease [Terrabacter sp. AAH1]
MASVPPNELIVPRAPATTPSASSALIRAKMQAQGSYDTKPEVALRRALHRRGVRFRRDQSLPSYKRRRADIVWRGRRLAVFVDGCFWHGCPRHFVLPKTNSSWWEAKIDGNRARDEETTLQLASFGWTVVRVWEHANLDEAADSIKMLLTQPPGGVVRIE